MSESFLIKRSLQIFRVLKVFGFAAFTIENGRSVTKPADILFFVVNFAVGFSLAHQSIKYRDVLISTDSEIIQVGYFVIYVASIIVSLISMLVAFLLRHKTWNMILQLDEVDRKFDEIDITQKCYSKNLRGYNIFTVAILSMSIPILSIVYAITESFLQTVLYLYSGLYFFLSVGLVVGIMNATRGRILLINTVLKSKVKTSKNINCRHKNIKPLKVLMDIYRRLMETYDSINICYGISTMLGFGFLFFYTIFTNFMVYKDIMNDDGSLSGVSKVSILFSSYLHVFTTSVIYLCTLTEKNADETLKLLNASLKRTSDEMEIALLMSFSSFVKRRPPKFSCGLFDFDWTLSYSVRT